jgi:hypothetical protein
VSFPRLLDFCFVLFAVAVVAVTAFFVYGHDEDALVLIQGSGGRRWQFPLDAVESLYVDGPLGTTKIELYGGKAGICDSPCENKSCILNGTLDKPGDWSACLPNQVMLSIEGSKNTAKKEVPDAVSW